MKKKETRLVNESTSLTLLSYVFNKKKKKKKKIQHQIRLQLYINMRDICPLLLYYPLELPGNKDLFKQ